MTPKQKAFCEYYIASGNATEAAIKAGYSKKTAYSIGNENLKKPEIQKYISEQAKIKESKRIATAEEILEFYSVVFRSPDLPLKDRLRAAENLAKRFGVDKEKKESEENAIDKLVDAIKELTEK